MSEFKKGDRVIYAPKRGDKEKGIITTVKGIFTWVRFDHQAASAEGNLVSSKRLSLDI